jgi:hypothetical protein
MKKAGNGTKKKAPRKLPKKKPMHGPDPQYAPNSKPMKGRKP